MKKYLGIVWLLYSFIFLYVTMFDKLKNFLAPQMQVYLKISIIPLLIMSFIILKSKHNHFKFKISDLILLIPLVFIILAGDARLTSSFANNRSLTYQVKKEVKKVDKVKKNEDIINDSEDEEDIEYDLNNIYFDVEDSNYTDLSGYLTFSPNAEKYKDKTIRVRGFLFKDSPAIPKNYFAVGKYSISCCAADAGFTGFVVKYDINKVSFDKWYEITGVLKKGKDQKNLDIMYIKALDVKEIDKETEEEYVYPCYSYDDGKCESFTKYNLE